MSPRHVLYPTDSLMSTRLGLSSGLGVSQCSLMFLFSFDFPGTSILRSHAAIERGRQLALDALSIVSHRVGRSLGWMADVMSLLAEIRQNSLVSINHLMELNHEESIPIAVLIKELIVNRETNVHREGNRQVPPSSQEHSPPATAPPAVPPLNPNVT